MPYFETADDLADHLADLIGIYEDPRCGVSEEATCRCDHADEESEPLEHETETYLGAEHCHLEDEPWEPHHIDGCNCRVWWVPAMADRIRQAVANEVRLAKALS